MRTMCFEVPKGGWGINRGKMISIKLERVVTERQNKIPVGLTIIVMTLTITSRTNNIIVVINKKVMCT